MPKITVTYEDGKKSIQIHKRDLDKLRDAIEVLDVIHHAVEGDDHEGDAFLAAQHIKSLLTVYGKEGAA